MGHEQRLSEMELASDVVSRSIEASVRTIDQILQIKHAQASAFLIAEAKPKSHLARIPT